MNKKILIWEIIKKIIIDGIIVTVVGALITEKIKKIFSQKNTNEKISISKPPHFQGKLIGRKKDIKRLNKKINNNQSVWISAPGGYGKSTLAISYVHKYRWKYPQIYWLSWKGSIEKTLTNDVNVVSSNEMKNDELYNSVRFFLRKQVSKKDLLVIDGLDEYDLHYSQESGHNF